MNKINKRIYITALFIIPFVLLMMYAPKRQLQHEINELQNNKQELLVQSGSLAEQITREKENFQNAENMIKNANTIMRESHDKANRLRTEKDIVSNQISGIEYQIAEKMGLSLSVNTNSEELLSEGKLLGHKYIIIHHTATKADTTVETILNNWDRKFGRPAAHFIIPADGNTHYVYDLDNNAGSTQNNGINNYAIQIELIGNFEDHKPTLAQYKALQQIIIPLEETYGKQEIIPHSEASASSCPGRYFDFDMLDKDLSNYIQFDFTRYYSPELGQNKYLSAIDGYFSEKYINMFSRYEKGYEMDVCMNCGCQLDENLDRQLYDCTVPADGLKLHAEEAMKVIACPQEYKLGTKFHIEGIGDVVCRDRGGAIEGNRMDIWMGYGDTAHSNWEKVAGGTQFGFIIED